MCDLCTRHKKVFTHEHELFTDKELEQHIRRGDDHPGAIDQSGFKGHPLCAFCGKRFYGDDELYVHCREKHERCFLCERRDGGRQPQYYQNIDSLWEHFRKDHFPCPEPECIEQKVIVFPSEIDLKAHQLEVHGNKLSKDVRRDARVVDISSFDYREPYALERRGVSQRENRGRGRGRNPNTEPLPISAAQPLRRDEQAFQRQMAIQSAQSVTTRTFGGQLTTTISAARPPGSREPLSTTSLRPSSQTEAVSTTATSTEPSNSSDPTPQEQARRLRHSAVVERASNLLQNDQLKLNQFRNAISSFRANTISASGLIDTFFALFDASSAALGTLIREVADLYEDQPKAESLRKAWNDWRSINEDYPSLPGLSGMSGSSLPLGWAQVTSSTPSSNPTPPKSTSRVLKLKSSTTQSSRSIASRTASWGNASSSTATPFPKLPTTSSANRTNPAVRIGTTPWSNPSAKTPYPSLSASSATASSRPNPPTPPTSRPSSRGPPRNVIGSDAFPALPPAPKPTSTIFGYGTGAVRRDAGGSSANNSPWGNSIDGRSADSSAVQSEGEGSAAHGGKRKGNKGKKQVLVQWG
jgi:E3 ubiquitin-protein ligase ZNF598